MSDEYQTHRLQWEGIAIEVRYDPDWLTTPTMFKQLIGNAILKRDQRE
jgi:hypothetical protein